jgi:hypothetical protein
MKIEIFDPPMCCPTGVCGPAVDPVLVSFQDTLRQIGEQTDGKVAINRHNLSAAPQSFVDNSAVADLLRSEGNAVLPLTFIDGALLAKGKYPTAGEFQKALREQGIEVNLISQMPRPSG